MEEGRGREQRNGSFFTGHQFEGSLKTGKKNTTKKKKPNKPPETDATPKKKGLGNASEELALKYAPERARRWM